MPVGVSRKSVGAVTVSGPSGDMPWLQVGRGGVSARITAPWPSPPPSGSRGDGRCGPCPREARAPVDPSSPPGPASHLPAPWAVSPCPVEAEEGGMSHERCLSRPGQCQAPDGRCQVVSIKAVLRGLGWASGTAGRGPV